MTAFSAYFCGFQRERHGYHLSARQRPRFFEREPNGNKKESQC